MVEKLTLHNVEDLMLLGTASGLATALDKGDDIRKDLADHAYMYSITAFADCISLIC